VKNHTDTLNDSNEIAGFLTELLGRPVTRLKVQRWAANGDICVGKFAWKLIASKQALRAEIEAKKRGDDQPKTQVVEVVPEPTKKWRVTR
jgi:hypothetical protein